MTKLTNREALTIAISSIADTDYRVGENTFTAHDVVSKLERMIEQIDKKASAERKPSVKQTVNDAFKADILAFLADGERRTVTEIIHGVESLNSASQQKVSAIVKLMTLDGTVVKEIDKRKSYFKIA